MNPSSFSSRQALPGPGERLRGDRIHRYVTAFCPRCHETNPPLAQVRRLSGVPLIRDDRPAHPGDLFICYVTSYALFRILPLLFWRMLRVFGKPLRPKLEGTVA